MTIWPMQNVDGSPAIRDEYNNRLATIGSSARGAPWQASGGQRRRRPARFARRGDQLAGLDCS